MAIKDLSKQPYKQDRDTNIKIGIDLPIRRDDTSDGFFATTSTTIEAVKNNIRNLLQTNEGERFFQPSLGLNLRNILFEGINDEKLLAIQDMILDKFELWLPFVEVRDIQINTFESDKIVGANEIRIKLFFNILQDPSTLESVTVNFNNEIPSSAGTGDGGGY